MPLAVIILVGVIFYALGRPTRHSVATEPVTGVYSQAAGAAGAAGAAI